MPKVEADGMEVLFEVDTSELDPKRDVRINASNLDAEFLKLPRLINDYGLLHEIAEAEAAALKYKLERVEAMEDHSTRQEALTNKVKLTEAMVKHTIVVSDNYKKVKLQYLEKLKAAALFKAVVNALYAKKDCLVSMGANVRAGTITPKILREELEEDRVISKDDARRSTEKRAREILKKKRS